MSWRNYSDTRLRVNQSNSRLCIERDGVYMKLCSLIDSPVVGVDRFIPLRDQLLNRAMTEETYHYLNKKSYWSLLEELE